MSVARASHVRAMRVGGALMAQTSQRTGLMVEWGTLGVLERFGKRAPIPRERERGL
jgi:hypothetical protein